MTTAEDITGPGRLELFTGARHLWGNCGQLEDRRQLSDVLNSHDETLVLSPVCIEALSGNGSEVYDQLSLEKRSLCLAMRPEDEAGEVTSAGAPQQALRALIVCPPFVAEGTLHLPYGVLVAGGSLNDMLLDNRFGRVPLHRFFALSDATLFIEGQAARHAAAVFINRGAVTDIQPGFGPSQRKSGLTELFSGIG